MESGGLRRIQRASRERGPLFRDIVDSAGVLTRTTTERRSTG